MRNKRGGILAFFLLILWFALVFVGVAGYLLYKNNYLRVEYGPPPKKDEIIIDKNTALQLKKKHEELLKFEKELRKREANIVKREEEIRLAKKSLEDINAKIEEHARKIESMFQRFSKEEEDDFKRLSKVYETMKADKVVNIFEKLDKYTIAELLKRIKKNAAAKILGEMGVRNPEWAAAVSDIMQGKDKNEAFKAAGKV